VRAATDIAESTERLDEAAAEAANEPLDSVVARLDLIVGLLERLVAAHDAAAAGCGTRGQDEKEFLSLNATARRLGIDRKTTLPDLITDKRLLAVKVGNRQKVPVSEIERIKREGTVGGRSKRMMRPASSSQAPLAADLAAGVRRLKV
jgi:hypothetical protein